MIERSSRAATALAVGASVPSIALARSRATAAMPGEVSAA